MARDEFNENGSVKRVVDEKGIVRYFNSKGQLHREDGPALIKADGEKNWFRNGKIHRDNGPAVEEPDGTKAWYRDGLQHREDGPALELPMFGGIADEWWIDGKQLTREQFISSVAARKSSHPGRNI